MFRPWLAALAIPGVLVACTGAPNPSAPVTGGIGSAGLAAAATSPTAVTWSVQEGSAGGSVSTSGLYTAPATVGTYHVVVAAVADPTKAAAAAATINGGWVSPGAVSGDVIVFADSSAGAAQISPWIYGMNDAADTGSWGTHPTLRYVTGTRMGGNRMSEYNWENNFSNAGTDYGQLHNDDLFAVGDTTPGAGVRAFLDPIYGRTGTIGNAALLAVPLIGYVSGGWTGYATVPTAASTTTQGVPSVGTGTGQFLAYLTSRPGDSSHALATATPVTTDAAVYEDDFLKWIGATYPGHNTSAAEPLFISLDGEPDGWGDPPRGARRRGPEHDRRLRREPQLDLHPCATRIRRSADAVDGRCQDRQGRAGTGSKGVRPRDGWLGQRHQSGSHQPA